MKFLSFRVLLLCMVLPPVFYVLTLFLLERHVQRVYTTDIQAVYIGPAQPLLEGEIRLQEAVEKNVRRYLEKQILIRWGLDVRVTIATEGGVLLYPSFSETPPLMSDERIDIAARNFRLMNADIRIGLDTEIPYNTPLSYLILGIYILCSLLLLFFYHRRGLRRLQMTDRSRQQEIRQLQEETSAHQNRLSDLSREREALAAELKGIRDDLLNERENASRNENGMIDEIVRLEEKLSRNLAHQQEREAEIEELKEQIALFEAGKLKPSKQRAKDEDIFRKRFGAIYKNVALHPRALSGYTELPEDLKIRAEEVIHQLDDDPGKVAVKRKVFGKKNRETVLEVLFSYKGRLYFRSMPDGRIEVLVIGTKNTQTKDLEFINSL